MTPEERAVHAIVMMGCVDVRVDDFRDREGQKTALRVIADEFRAALEERDREWQERWDAQEHAPWESLLADTVWQNGIDKAVEAEREELQRFASHVLTITKLCGLASRTVLPNTSKQLMALAEDAASLCEVKAGSEPAGQSNG